MRGWRSALVLVTNIEYELEEDKLFAPQSFVVKFAVAGQVPKKTKTKNAYK